MVNFRVVGLAAVAGVMAIATPSWAEGAASLKPAPATAPVVPVAQPASTNDGLVVAPGTNPLQDLRTNDAGSNPLNQAQGINDILQRAMSAPSKSMDEFRSEQQESLNDAAAQFRKLQLERLRQSQPSVQPTPAAPILLPTK
jgi:hypothetical protein